MKLKGETFIELKDEKTGEVERLHDNNIVTNALKRAIELSYQYGGDIMKESMALLGGAREKVFFPVIRNLIGGIMCFSETLDESVDNIIAHPSIHNSVTAYGTNKVNTSVLKKLGSLNMTESGPIDGGYKFVWDFATSQGNGLISCVCLTTPGGGCYGNDLFPSRPLTMTRPSSNKDYFMFSNVSSGSPEASIVWANSTERQINIDDKCTQAAGEAISQSIYKALTKALKNAKVNENGDIEFTISGAYSHGPSNASKIKFNAFKVIIRGAQVNTLSDGLSHDRVDVSLIGSVYLFDNVSNNPWRTKEFVANSGNVITCWQERTYMFGYSHSFVGNKAVIVFVKSWVSPSPENPLGSCIIVKTTIDDITKESPVVSFEDINLNTYLYSINYFSEEEDIMIGTGSQFVNGEAVVHFKKFRVSNMSEVSSDVVRSPETGNAVTPYYMTRREGLGDIRRQEFVKVSDNIYSISVNDVGESSSTSPFDTIHEACKEFVNDMNTPAFTYRNILLTLNEDGTIRSVSPSVPLTQSDFVGNSNASAPSNEVSVFNHQTAESITLTPLSSRDIYIRKSIMQNFLFTINNLSQPVTKTADKTMKITYILREV